MDVIAAPNPLEMLLLMLLGGGFGMPPGMPPTEEAPLAAKVAPEECLFYASWAGTGTPDANSPNQTEQLLAEREVQDFLGAAQERMLSIVRQMASHQPGAQQTVDDVSKLLEFVRGKPGAMYITELSFKADGPPDVKGAGLHSVGRQDGRSAEAARGNSRPAGREQSFRREDRRSGVPSNSIRRADAIHHLGNCRQVSGGRVRRRGVGGTDRSHCAASRPAG